MSVHFAFSHLRIAACAIFRWFAPLPITALRKRVGMRHEDLSSSRGGVGCGRQRATSLAAAVRHDDLPDVLPASHDGAVDDGMSESEKDKPDLWPSPSIFPDRRAAMLEKKRASEGSAGSRNEAAGVDRR
jgi:hypothetical protein